MEHIIEWQCIYCKDTIRMTEFEYLTRKVWRHFAKCPKQWNLDELMRRVKEAMKELTEKNLELGIYIGAEWHDPHWIARHIIVKELGEKGFHPNLYHLKRRLTQSLSRHYEKYGIVCRMGREYKYEYALKESFRER